MIGAVLLLIFLIFLNSVFSSAEIAIVSLTEANIHKLEEDGDRRARKLSKITNLQDDIALALGASGVRIAPIPDKISVVGVEVPNKLVSPVSIRTVLESTEFTTHPSTTAFAVGKDISGKNIVGNISKLPHVLIAGTTGSGSASGSGVTMGSSTAGGPGSGTGSFFLPQPVRTRRNASASAHALFFKVSRPFMLC